MPAVNRSYSVFTNQISDPSGYVQTDPLINAINSTYTEAYCQQLEMAYGNHMMSEGGEKAIEEMFQGLSLAGKQMLDFGAGLGGVAFYLASQHGSFVKGIEINPRIVREANQRRPLPIKEKVSFSLIGEDQHLSYPNETFDIVYSKGVIVHLSQKQRDHVFQEFFRVLKKKGKLVIYDWVSPIQGQWSAKMQDLMETESLPLYAHSQASYKKELMSYGFGSLECSDRSKESARHNQEIVKRLTSPEIKDNFIQKFGEETYHDHLRGYENIRDVLISGELINLSLRAEKEVKK